MDFKGGLYGNFAFTMTTPSSQYSHLSSSMAKSTALGDCPFACSCWRYWAYSASCCGERRHGAPPLISAYVVGLGAGTNDPSRSELKQVTRFLKQTEDVQITNEMEMSTSVKAGLEKSIASVESRSAAADEHAKPCLGHKQDLVLAHTSQHYPCRKRLSGNLHNYECFC